jgi:hypothetical protein
VPGFRCGIVADASVALGESCAVIDGRAAPLVAQMLAGELRGRMPLRRIVAEMRLSPADQAAVLAAELALEDAGERWRIASLPQRGNAETRGNAEPLASEEMVTTAHAAQVLGVPPRRVRQLRKAGDLRAVSSPGGWSFDRAEVIAYGTRRRGGDDALTSPSHASEVAA